MEHPGRANDVRELVQGDSNQPDHEDLLAADTTAVEAE
jgi:hypothetical protein